MCKSMKQANAGNCRWREVGEGKYVTARFERMLDPMLKSLGFSFRAWKALRGF